MRGLRASRTVVGRAVSFGRRASLRLGRPAPRGEVAVSYGRRLPSLDAHGRGGTVKFQRLARALPDAGARFNILYLGSSDRPDDTWQLIRLARGRDAAFVWNQDGVAYPGWAGDRSEAINRPLARALHAADHVLYQSEFCKVSADRFLEPRDGPWEILHNAVDTMEFTPGSARTRPLTLLLGGDQYQRYRLEVALRTLAAVVAERPDARLLVAGRLSFPGADRDTSDLIRALGLERAVELLGPYAQHDAPALFRRADILLHTKYNDPCPTTVLEAMSCALPVVYSASGGVPELVGAEAGAGVPAPLDFERDHPPDPAELAERVLAVAERRNDYAEAARRRAVERFDLKPWIERHRELFERLVA